MKHWSSKYIAIPYKNMHCSAFVEFVLRDHFNIDFKFPQSEGYIFNQSEQIKKHIPEFTHYPERTDDPKDGDLVLMHGKRLMCHVGLYVNIKKVEYVLHSEASIGSACLNKIKEVSLFGYKIEGVYKWQK